MKNGYLQIVTTTGSREDADRLAGGVVGARLAACVQVMGPVRSTYWWRGAVETADEWICVMKTTTARFNELEAYVKNHHSYETPEIIATPIVDASGDYLAWILAETGGAEILDERS